MQAVAKRALPLLLAGLALASGCQRGPGASRQYLFGGAPAVTQPPATEGAVVAPAADPGIPAIDIEIPGQTTARAATDEPPAAVAAAEAQVMQLQRQLADLERNNEDLHRQVASTEQQSQLFKDQVALLQRQLSDTASQLRDSQLARDEADRRAEAMLASTRQGSAGFSANNSVTQSLEAISLPGLEVRQDGDVIRIEIPADKLFQPASVEWTAGAAGLLDQVGDAVRRNYPRQQVAIEGHTDSSIIGLPGGSQQLSASQSLAVYQHLTQRSRIPARQLITMAYGPNYPRVSNATDEGRAKNRRIELVIYPEQIKP